MRNLDTIDLKIRAGIYGSNGVLGLASRAIGYSLGNPIGAIGFASLDIASFFSDKIRYGKFSKIAKGLGAAYYGLVFTIPDAVSLAGGEISAVPNLLLDGSLTCLLGVDALKAYLKSKDSGESTTYENLDPDLEVNVD